jgi:hypothetical protein
MQAGAKSWTATFINIFKLALAWDADFSFSRLGKVTASEVTIPR